MVRDAVIIDVEFRMESDYEPYGHFINLRFVDESPTLIKLSSFIKQLSAFNSGIFVSVESIKYWVSNL